MTAQMIAAAFAGVRIAPPNEDALQVEIERLLKATWPALAVEREVRLEPHGRIDLLVGQVGIEAKIADARADVLRQLHGYAESPRVAELVLVTTRRLHTVEMPSHLLGKPLVTVYVGAPW